MAKDLFDFIDNNERKSIPLDYFREKGYLLQQGYMPRIDYLKIVDKVLEVSNNGKKE